MKKVLYLIIVLNIVFAISEVFAAKIDMINSLTANDGTYSVTTTSEQAVRFYSGNCTELNDIYLKLNKGTATSGWLYINMYSDNAGQIGSHLSGFGALNVSNLSAGENTYSWIGFTLEITTNTYYWLKLSGSPVGGNCSVYYASDCTPDYTGCANAKLGINSGSWSYTNNAALSVRITGTVPPPAAPTNLTNTSKTTSSLDFSWALNAASNQVVLADNGDNSDTPVDGVVLNVNDVMNNGGIVKYKGTNTSYSLTGLTPNSYYNIQLWSVDNDNNYSNSTSNYFTTKPLAPIAAAATNIVADGFKANWTEPNEMGNMAAGWDIDHYVIQYDDNNSFSSPIQVDTITNLFFNISGITAGTYYYRVLLKNANGDESVWSNTITVSMGPDDPGSLTASVNSSSQIDLSWALNGSSDPVLVAYNSINIFGSPSGTYSAGNSISGGGTVLYAGTNTNFNHSGIASGTHYYYKIWSKDGSNNYSSGLADDEYTKCAAPTASDATNIVAGSFSTNWEAATGATKYYLDVSESNTFDSFVSGFENKDVSNVLTYSVTGLNPETTYYYRVRAYNSSGSSANSNTITAVTLKAYFSDGTNQYATWNEAVAGTTEGGTITMLDNYILSSDVTLTKSFDLNISGFTFSGTGVTTISSAKYLTLNNSQETGTFSGVISYAETTSTLKLFKSGILGANFAVSASSTASGIIEIGDSTNSITYPLTIGDERFNNKVSKVIAKSGAVLNLSN